MKILQLCKKFPYPINDGESIAVSALSRALNELGCEMTLLAMNTSKHFTDIDSVPEEFSFYHGIHAVEVDNMVKPWPAVKNLFSSESYHISRFVSEEYSEKLSKLLKAEDYDIIQLESLYLTPYLDIIKKNTDAIVVMRAHNIESEIWERISSNTQFLPKKIYLSHLTKKLKNYELEHLNDYDFLVTVSDRDLQEFKKLGYKNGAMSSPIGLPISDYQSDLKEASYDIGFIGTMDWMPNEEGIDWFIEEVLPLIKKEMPQVSLHIAGRNSDDKSSKWNEKGVVIHGEVDSAADFVSNCKMIIVPLFSGSGTRVKILESLAMKKAIVSTSIGSEGIELEHEKEVFIHDEPQAFANSVLYLLKNEKERNAMGEKGYDFVVDRYDSLANAKKLVAQYKKILSDSNYSPIPKTQTS